MRRADPSKTSLQVLHDLKRINATCDFCQRLAQAPHRFRVALTEEDMVLNRTVRLDLLYLDSSAVLHVVARQ